MNSSIATQDKIEYIAAELYYSSTRFRIITERAIEAVIDNPPRDVRIIRSRELAKINQDLMVPLVAETVQEIVRISKEYDKIKTDNVKKPVQKAHEFTSTNSHPQGKLCYNI